MFLRITSHSDGGVTIIETVGELALGRGTDALREIIHQMSSGGQKRMILNFRGITSLDASAVDELIAARGTIRLAGGDLKIAGIRVNPSNIIAIARLYSVFEIFEDETSAVRSFGEGPRRQGSQFGRPTRREEPMSVLPFSPARR